MEEIFAIIVGNSRRETLLGKDYIVANLTLLVPGVLNGSKGPLLYPPGEVSHQYDAWNNMPLVVNHPTVEGVPTSARQPAILEKFGIGYVFNTRYNDRLQAEGWFDIEATKRVDIRIFNALEAGKKIELSTGLRVEATPAPKDSTYNGKKYIAIARNYRPDHLAILPDHRGACSTADGCGVNNQVTDTNVHDSNTNGDHMKLNAVKRKKFVDFIIANCDCWKDEGDADTLNEMSDEKLIKIHAGVVQSKQNRDVVNTLRTELTINEEEELTPELITESIKKKTTPVNPKKKAQVSNVDEDEEEEDEEDEDTARTPKNKKKVSKVTNTTPARKTAQEWLEEAPEEIREVINTAKGIYGEKKQEVINKLTSHIKDKKKKADTIKLLANKKLPELQELLMLLPEPVSNRRDRSDDLLDAPNYTGAAGAHTTNDDDDQDDDDSDILPIYNDESDEDDDDDRGVFNRFAKRTNKQRA